MFMLLKFISGLLFLSGLAVAQTTSTQPWHLQKSENGISVYSRGAENSKIKELKSVFQVKTSLSSIVALLNDFESYTHWTYRCGTSTTIRKIAENEYIHYQTVMAPWPVDDRDFVVHTVFSQNSVTKVVLQKATCLADAAPLVEGRVRIEVFKAGWTLTPLKNGMVNVEYQLLVDPGGNVPAWLVNLAAVDGPYETQLEMKEWVMKEKYQKAIIPHIMELE